MVRFPLGVVSGLHIIAISSYRMYSLSVNQALESKLYSIYRGIVLAQRWLSIFTITFISQLNDVMDFQQIFKVAAVHRINVVWVKEIVTPTEIAREH